MAKQDVAFDLITSGSDAFAGTPNLRHGSPRLLVELRCIVLDVDAGDSESLLKKELDVVLFCLPAEPREEGFKVTSPRACFPVGIHPWDGPEPLVANPVVKQREPKVC